jgi:predicted  nucleic acid-binding Zn-ribbon protein
MNDEIEILQRDISDLEGQLSTMKEEITTLQEDLEDRDNTIRMFKITLGNIQYELKTALDKEEAYNHVP